MVAGVGTGGWPSHITGEWTVEMLDALPEDNLRYELLDGTLLVSPSRVPLHQAVIGELYLLLRAACPPDHFVFLSPLDWRPDGRTSLEPDLLVVRRDRIGSKNIQETPTLVVEVISPSSARIDRMLKFSRYAEGGIEQYWMVDPRVPSIAVYRLVDGDYSLLADAHGAQIVALTTPLTISLTPDQLITI
ncbi:MAG: Uma2 family endonuclease [Nakamurella sp.]